MLKNLVLIIMREAPPLEELEKELKEHQVRLWRQIPSREELEEDFSLEETLFITDNQEAAEELLKGKAAVLGWLSEGGRQRLWMDYVVERLEELDFSYLEKVYNRYRSLPWRIAETDRCRIREMTEEDLDALYSLYADKELTRYMEDLYEDREQEREYMRSYINSAYAFWGFGTWIIEEKAGDRVIGRVGFNLREGYELPELGFVIARQWQRQGLAYEVCMAALEVGKREYDFQAVQTLVKEENTASLGLCGKLGFRRIKTVQEGQEEYILLEKRL